MRIQVITSNNGYGLTKDIHVLREALEPLGHSIDTTDWERPRPKGRWDWNIHLELVNPAHFRSATVNAFVPNPEWTEDRWIREIPRFDVVLAKTRDCEAVFKALHPNVVFTGWTSPDTDLRVDFGRHEAVHCVGGSISKGTNEVLEAATMVPELPLTILTKNKLGRSVPKHVTVRTGYLPEAEYNEIRRAPIHLCPSSYEGFGHYINEARAMGAVIITTDAPPMDEVATVEHAIMVPPCKTRRMRRAVEQVVCVDALAEAMRAVCDHVNVSWGACGIIARRAYENDRAAFHERIKSVIA